MFLKLAKFSLYASLFSVLVVLTTTFFPFIGGKYYFFRLTVELATIFFILWWAFEAPPGKPLAMFKSVVSRPLFIAVSVFVLAFLLAAIFAHDPSAAFWSNYERGDGGFQMIHYYAFFVLLAMLFNKWSDWRLAFRLVMAVSILMILYGVFAQFQWVDRFISPYQGNTPASAWENLTKARFQGSLGNPAYVAPYLIFSFFFALYLWLEKGKAKKPNSQIIKNLLYGSFVLFSLFFFAISQTRGAFLGLVAALIFFLIYFGFKEPKYRGLALGILAGLLVLGGWLVNSRNSGFVKALPGGRLFDLPFSMNLLAFFGAVVMIFATLVMFSAERRYRRWTLSALAIMLAAGTLFLIVKPGFIAKSFADQTANTRFWTWGSAWQGFKERPVLGWGPENFSTVFDKYFDTRHYVPGAESETWFDRAHSVIFDYLAETGLIGLLSYLGIFAVFCYEFFKKFHLKPRGHHEAGGELSQNLQNGLLFVLPLGYLIQGLALFDVLPIYLPLFMFLAFGFYKLYGSETETHVTEKDNMNPMVKKVAAGVITVVIFGVLYYGTYLPFKKSRAFIGVMRDLNNVKTFDDFKKVFSVALDIPSPVGQEELVRNLGNLITNTIQQRDDSPEFVKDVIDYLNFYYKPIIDKGRGMSFSQNLYILGALNELAFVKTNNVQYVAASEDYFLRGLERGPKRPQFLYGLFDIYRIQRNVPKAQAVAEQILSQWPDDKRTKEALDSFLKRELTK